jgi:hypothetical protein
MNAIGPGRTGETAGIVERSLDGGSEVEFHGSQTS